MEKRVLRGSVQSFRGIVAGASHYIGVLEDMRSRRSWQSCPLDSKREALDWIWETWRDEHGPEGSVLVLASITDWCAM